MSTKRTLLYGKDFHLYRDGFDYLPILEIKRKKVDLPEEFAECLLKLLVLQESHKTMLQVTKWLDKHDGGIFGLNMETGETSEFVDGEFK